MKRFFDFNPNVWAYFAQVDNRLNPIQPPQIHPAVSKGTGHNLKNVSAVLWDVYGTLLTVEVGELPQSCQMKQTLEIAALTTIHEFSLEKPLRLRYPHLPPPIALSTSYLNLIAESHRCSEAQGIEYPEVVIEDIWKTILRECQNTDWQPDRSEPLTDTAFRIAYFFDAALQRNYLNLGVEKVLSTLKDAGIRQGIISNAQFYTPIQIRRLLRKALGRKDFELDEFFEESLLLFSYQLGYSKPNPGGYLKALEILARQGIKAEEIVYIGNDMLNDVWGASQHGMKTVLFAVDQAQTVWRQEDERCRDLQADGVVQQSGQIIEMILGV